MNVHISQFRPFTIGAGHTVLYKFIANKRACIDVHCPEGMCFHYTIISALFPAEQNGHRMISYLKPHEVLNTEGLSDPVVKHDIVREEHKQQRMCFVDYCDIESGLKPLSTCLPDNELSNTTTFNQHVLNPCSILLVCSYNHSLSNYFKFVGDDCMYQFVDKLVESTKWVAEIYSVTVAMKPEPPAGEAMLAAQKYNTQFELAKKKGVFPCDFVKSPDGLMYTSLPPEDTFYNVMEGEGISDEDYAHAQAAWDTFNYMNLLQYAIQHLYVDTCLLADVSENFGTACLAHYGLDPIMYVTAPSFSWDALLSMTYARLELFTDPDIYIFVACEEYHDALSDLPLPVTGIPPNVSHEKCLLTLVLKKKYVIHRETLKHYLMYGANLDSVHRVLHFEQYAWLVHYIEFDIDKHAQAAN
ncbi:hypothetical protein PR048_009988 [Dryococelus australis]|uniref:Uncharacterized protein n=1 Tax=Dryococelus australis TaxID=614101 RepID=A0ABQ9I1I2_9NEOP|nr:hypothetical protein PR048_009988 [Dryococelus australis]